MKQLAIADIDFVPPEKNMDVNTVIEKKAQLIDYLAGGSRSSDQFRLGAEQELFVFSGSNLSPAIYEGPVPGIKALLESLYHFNWNPVEENGTLIGLSRGNCSITLEPGGQFEFVGAPLVNAHQTASETQSHYAELAEVGSELGLNFLALGHHPQHSREDVSWMPKDRYRVMRSYMPTRGNLGLDMMLRTCSIQVAADFSDEADMVKKFRVALALQPIVLALFANSPFKEGRVGEYLSHRAAAWSDTDPDRCGNLPFVFEDGMGFERYVDYVLDVPMYFVIDQGKYVDASGLSFRDFLDGRLAVLPGRRPTIADWDSHLSTVFPHVRLKRFLEFRGADAGDAVNRVPALVALWAGLLYDTQSLEQAWGRIEDWTIAEQTSLESAVIRNGFNAPFRDQTVQELALWMLDLSRKGLERRNFQDEQGETESRYLLPLVQAAESGQTFAEQLVHEFSNQWHDDMKIALPAMCQDAMP